MKNLITVLIGLLLSCGVIMAQPRLGFKGGLNLSSFNGDEITTTNLNRAAFGVFGEIPLVKNLSFSTEINYSNEGAEISNTVVDQIRTSYLEIPVLANVYLGNGAVRPKLFGGPSMSFLMNAESELENGSTIEIDESYKENEIGVVLGAGVDVKITGENYFLLDLRYDFGLTEMERIELGSFQNRGFRIMAGFSFPIKSNY